MDHAKNFLKVVNDAKSKIHETNVVEVKRRLDAGEQFTLVDTREDSEWERGHIAGAIHIGRGVIERDIERLIPDAATPLVLYCGGGFRSALAAESLQNMGYTDVLSMDGGWKAWNTAGYPTAVPSR
jgi:rhodanese-related sulfurtransferase